MIGIILVSNLSFFISVQCDLCLSLTACINVERVEVLRATEKLGGKKSGNSQNDGGGRTLDTSVSPG